MKKRTAAFVAVALTLGLGFGGAEAASAASNGAAEGGVTISGDQQSGSSGARIGGSFWQWGVGKDDTWSNYFHENQCHGATAVGQKTKRVTGVGGGRYALATTPKKLSGNQAFWHRC